MIDSDCHKLKAATAFATPMYQDSCGAAKIILWITGADALEILTGA
jgi:hypothetical protein